MIMIAVLTHALLPDKTLTSPMMDRGKLHLTLSSQYPPVSSSPRPSDNLTLPYPYYLHFPHEIHTFNQDMGKFTCFLFAGTPPLPALSPGQSANQTPQSSPDFRAKYKMNQTPTNLNNRPDLLENENPKKMQVQSSKWRNNKVQCNSNPVLLVLCDCGPLNTATQKKGGRCK